jgi:hypothetical protein
MVGVISPAEIYTRLAKAFVTDGVTVILGEPTAIFQVILVNINND